MMYIDNFQDFIKAHADAAGMTREEFMAVLMSENTTIQEGLSKSAIKKQIKVIDKQIEDEEGGDGEPLTSETLQDLERERERLLALIESVVTEGKDDRSHIILRVEPRNYDNMVDKLQDMRVNHNQESKNTIKVYTDKTSGWYGNSKAQYKLTHDVWVDKFVINEASQEAYSLHRLGDGLGQSVAAAFLKKHNVDLELLTKAIVYDKTITKYELRDIVNGTAHKFKIKNFMKDFVTEGTYNSKDHIGDTSDGQGSNAEIYKKGKGYYVVVSGEVDYDFTAKNDKELLQKLKDNEFDNTDILESMTLGFSSQDFRRNSLNEAEKAKGDRSAIDDDAIETGLKKKATESGVPIGLLRLVMRRGLEAWNSSHRPGTTKQQWGYARVNAFLEKGKGTWQGADADIAKEVRDSNKDSKLPIKNPSQYTKKERES